MMMRVGVVAVPCKVESSNPSVVRPKPCVKAVVPFDRSNGLSPRNPDVEDNIVCFTVVTVFNVVHFLHTS